MAVINTNSLSLIAQGNLQKSQGALGTAIERLSSGLRINSAKDDAAGQAIANRFTSNIRGLTQATRNANDGISIAQTTEGSLNEINNNLQRVRELTVQAANGSNSATDLKSIQDEIGQRLGEINRVSEQTQFNGVKVLDNGATSLAIQVGANDGETISIGLKAINQTALGLTDFTVQKNTLTVGNAIAPSATSFNSVTVQAVDMTAAIATLKAGGVANADADAATLHQVVDADGVAVANSFAMKAGDNFYAVDITTAGSAAADAVVDVTTLGVDSAVTIGGTPVTVPDTTLVKLGSNGTAAETYVTFAGENYKAGIAATVAGYDTPTTATDLDATGAFVGAGTANPMDKLDDALAIVDALRGELGAVQNRFESTIANLSNTVTNMSSARSRIEDADYAVEVSNMTRAQILQQAGTSVLAQANQVPQSVLSLLR